MFEADLGLGQKGEDVILKIIQKKYPNAHRIIGYFRGYDIFIPEVDIKVEVKSDRLSKKTGNIAIEYGCNNKASGIITTEADYWGLIAYSLFYSDWIIGIIEVIKLYEIAEQYGKSKKGKEGSFCWILNFDKYILNNLDFQCQLPRKQ